MILNDFIIKLKNHTGRLSSGKVLAQPGEHHSSRKTLQEEIEDRRPYYPGDDLKYLDWKQFARSDRYFVKQASTPSKSKLVFIMDNSQSMFFVPKKYNHSVLTMLALIYNALQSGDRVAVSLLNENQISFQKRNLFPTLYENWTGLEKDKSKLSLNIKNRLATLLNSIPKNSFVVFLSDLYLPLPDLKDILSLFHNKKVELLFLHSLHLDEGLPSKQNNWTRLIDTETSRSLLLSPAEIKNISQLYNKAILARKEIIKKYHSFYYFLDTDQSPFFHVNKLYGGKF